MCAVAEQPGAHIAGERDHHLKVQRHLGAERLRTDHQLAELMITSSLTMAPASRSAARTPLALVSGMVPSISPCFQRSVGGESEDEFSVDT